MDEVLRLTFLAAALTGFTLATDTITMKTLLEAVPPERHRGEAAVEAVIEKIAAVHAKTPLDGINIPEIHQEPARSHKGERRQPFAPRIAPRDLARRIQEQLGLRCMINHVVVHHTDAQALLDWAHETYELCGIDEFVLVGGGEQAIAYPGPSVPQANTLLREHAQIPNLRLGNICIPSRVDEAQRMAAKGVSGVDFFTTQILYEAADFNQLLDCLHAQQAPINEVFLAFCPVRNQQNIRFLLWLGVAMPDALEAWLGAVDDQVQARSLEQIRRTWAQIVAHVQSIGVDAPQLGINLAPIGPIGAETTAALATDLAAVHAQAIARV